MQDLSVGLGDTLELVLLLDGVAVGGSLGGIDQLVSETLGNGLDVAESSLTSSSAEKPDSLKLIESEFYNYCSVILNSG